MNLSEVSLGVVFPQSEIGDDPVVIRDFAQAAEELGYGFVLAYDHVLGAAHADRDPPLTGPYTEQTAFHEVFVLFGFLAAATSRIELATGVLILPQRQTALVAKQAAEVDILSRGRLRLGVGLGWNYVEFDSLNQEFHTRGRRCEEQVDVLRQLWASELLDYRGADHRIDRASILPRPGRQIPIWFGGHAPAALRRAARLGDGFMLPPGSRETVVSCKRRVEQHLDATARNRDGFGFQAFVEYDAGPGSWRDDVEFFAGASCSHIVLRTMQAGLRSPQDHLDALEAYAAHVGDALERSPT